MTDWIAVCAPGRKLITALSMQFREETVIDVWESPVIEGNTVVLINADPYRELRERLHAMPFDFGNLSDEWKIGYRPAREGTENLCTGALIARTTAG